MATFLVRYGELALKSPRVQSRFKRLLIDDIQGRFATAGKECLISHERGRVWLDSDDGDFARSVLGRTFGVVSFSPVETTDADFRSIGILAQDMFGEELVEGTRFAVRPRRSGSHDFTSQDLGREVGSILYLANPGLSVDLEHPDVEVFVEVRDRRAYVFGESYFGPGGLPAGSQGRACALVDGPGSVVAAWLIMRRGCRMVPLVYSTDRTVPDELEETLEVLGNWQGNLRPFFIDRKSGKGKDDWTVDPEVARAARVKKCQALVSGALGPTIHPPSDVGLPVFYPLSGFSDDDIEDMWISIRDGKVPLIKLR